MKKHIERLAEMGIVRADQNSRVERYKHIVSVWSSKTRVDRAILQSYGCKLSSNLAVRQVPLLVKMLVAVRFQVRLPSTHLLS